MPSETEIWEAISNMNANGAAGPNGLNGKFYVNCWRIIKVDLISAVQYLFHSHPLLKSWTSTVIVAIPKVNSPKSFGDTRPISLRNFSAKIIYKLVTDRLASILPNLISLEHGSFTKGRNITDNILLTRELLQDSRIRGCNVVFKINLAKAYDRLSWLFLLHVLRKFGFLEQFIDIIWRIIPNCWYSVLINVAREIFLDLLGG